MSFYDGLPGRILGHPSCTPAGWGRPLTRLEAFERKHPKLYRLAYLLHEIFKRSV